MRAPRKPHLAGLPLSVWPVGQQPSRIQRRGRYLPAAMAHPAKMLPALARHAITTFTEPGDVVLDPMCGIGTTLIEAGHAGRDAVGIEYETRWADLAAAGLTHAVAHGATGRAQVIRGDARTAAPALAASYAGQVALLLTSPPYGASVHGQVRATGTTPVQKWDHAYSRDHANLAHTPTPDLLAAFTDILRACRPLLRPGGVVAVTARPWRQHGVLYDFPSAVLQAVADAGYHPVQRCVALLAAVRGGRLVTRASFFQLQQARRHRAAGLPVHLVAHEDVLIARKAAPTDPQSGPADRVLRRSPPTDPRAAGGRPAAAERRAA